MFFYFVLTCIECSSLRKTYDDGVTDTVFDFQTEITMAPGVESVEILPDDNIRKNALFHHSKHLSNAHLEYEVRVKKFCTAIGSPPRQSLRVAEVFGVSDYLISLYGMCKKLKYSDMINSSFLPIWDSRVKKSSFWKEVCTLSQMYGIDRMNRDRALEKYYAKFIGETEKSSHEILEYFKSSKGFQSECLTLSKYLESLRELSIDVTLSSIEMGVIESIYALHSQMGVNQSVVDGTLVSQKRSGVQYGYIFSIGESRFFVKTTIGSLHKTLDSVGVPSVSFLEYFGFQFLQLVGVGPRIVKHSFISPHFGLIVSENIHPHFLTFDQITNHHCELVRGDIANFAKQMNYLWIFTLIFQIRDTFDLTIDRNRNGDKIWSISINGGNFGFIRKGNGLDLSSTLSFKIIFAMGYDYGWGDFDGALFAAKALRFDSNCRFGETGQLLTQSAYFSSFIEELPMIMKNYAASSDLTDQFYADTLSGFKDWMEYSGFSTVELKRSKRNVDSLVVEVLNIVKKLRRGN